MGQPITVAAQPSSNPRVLRFEINRSLTGMSHERYHSAEDAVANRPVDELARRLFEHGGVHAVHVNSNVITVELAGGSTGAGLDDVIARLFRFYPDTPPADDAPAASADEVATGAEPEPDAAATPEAAADTADATDETAEDAPGMVGADE
jgi:hypothetical protein